MAPLGSATDAAVIRKRKVFYIYFMGGYGNHASTDVAQNDMHYMTSKAYFHRIHGTSLRTHFYIRLCRL
jgi:hypothetical protein